MLSVLTALLLLTPSPEESVQRRNFKVTVNGKPAGTYTQVIKTTSLTTEVTSSSTVNVKVLIVKYHYSFQGVEEWMGKGTVLQLYKVKAELDDGGKIISSSVTPAKGELLMKSTVATQALPRNGWTSTYWCLPPEEVRGKTISLANFEYGKPEQVKLAFVGKETVNGVECTHWKVTGLSVVDLWYDQSERLVKRAMIRKGQSTVIDLVSIQ